VEDLCSSVFLGISITCKDGGLRSPIHSPFRLAARPHHLGCHLRSGLPTLGALHRVSGSDLGDNACGITTCAKCGLLYCPDLAQDQREHRLRHRRWAAIAKPKPDKRLASSPATVWIGELGLVSVDWCSRRWLNKAVYARPFRREFGYDFIQWYENGPEEGPDKARAFLFVDAQSVIAGACAFHWMVYTNAPHAWSLSWVWLEPRFRRRGFLTRAWPFFTEQFGNFSSSEVTSIAMAMLRSRFQTPNQFNGSPHTLTSAHHGLKLAGSIKGGFAPCDASATPQPSTSACICFARLQRRLAIVRDAPLPSIGTSSLRWHRRRWRQRQALS
jgi:hypothetical protein